MYIMLPLAFMLLAVICGLCCGCLQIGDQIIHAELEEINEINANKILHVANKHKKFTLVDSDCSDDSNDKVLDGKSSEYKI